MSVARYLVDTSALIRLLRDPTAEQLWDEPRMAGLLAVCPIVELELLYTARSRRDRDTLFEDLKTDYGWVVMPDRAFERAAATQEALTGQGLHRSAGTVDLLVAATAELHELTLLHYDRDFEHLAAVTGQPSAWVAPPGSLN
ncbi:MAG: PIN domain nuclease [Micromonosporaceae bacterium]